MSVTQVIRFLLFMKFYFQYFTQSKSQKSPKSFEKKIFIFEKKGVRNWRNMQFGISSVFPTRSFICWPLPAAARTGWSLRTDEGRDDLWCKLWAVFNVFPLGIVRTSPCSRVFEGRAGKGCTGARQSSPGHWPGQSIPAGEAECDPSAVPALHFHGLWVAADQPDSLSQKMPMLNRHKFQIILVSVKLSNNEYKSPVLSLALLLLRDVYDIPVMCYSSALVWALFLLKF